MSGPTRPVVAAEAQLDFGGDEPITEKQAAQLRQLCEELDEEFDGNLTEVQAKKRIAALQEMKSA
jgi:uncharacterized damage-inducible protein DinB